METIRLIYIASEIKYPAPIIAFFEIVIWLPAIEVVMNDLSLSRTFGHLPSGLPWARISDS
jgi:uncharacterized protein YebE (UPF0316 family)